eukprot:4086674-Pyramimonas_sp.AAC.1
MGFRPGQDTQLNVQCDCFISALRTKPGRALQTHGSSPQLFQDTVSTGPYLGRGCRLMCAAPHGAKQMLRLNAERTRPGHTLQSHGSDMRPDP